MEIQNEVNFYKENYANGSENTEADIEYENFRDDSALYEEMLNTLRGTYTIDYIHGRVNEYLVHLRVKLDTIKYYNQFYADEQTKVCTCFTMW